MARARSIKPGFYANEDLADCDIWARFVFPGLWMLADREGRLEDRPKRIKSQLLPYDGPDCDPLLQQLADRGFILRYEVDDQRLIQIVNFSKHQNPHHREAPSKLPPPPGWVPASYKPEAFASSDGSETSGMSGASPGLSDHEHDLARGQSRAESLFSDSLSISTEAAASAGSDPKPGTAGQGIEWLFELFYDAYPRKVGKDAARRAFAKRKPDEALVSLMVQAISRQRLAARCAAGEAQYVPHPSTWLNEGRWQDEDGASVQQGKCPVWCTKAGFPNVYEAGNAGCFEHNADEFRAGRRIAEGVH